MKTCYSNSAKITIASKTKLFYRLLKLKKHQQVSNESIVQELALRNISLNRVFADQWSHDMIVNCSGLIKIDNLDSCKDFTSSDFTIF